MATRARRRLGQTEHFLQLAESNARDRSLFTTYLEVFVAFGRSVIHVLRNESEEADAWICFKSEWDALGQEPLPKFFQDTRDMILKEGKAADAHAMYSVSLSSGLYVTEGLGTSVMVTRADGTIETTEVPPAPETRTILETLTENSVRYYFAADALKGQDVIAACHQYVERLQKAIVAAEKCGA